MPRENWEDGYRDGHVGREENAPTKSPFRPDAPERYDYKDGYKEGDKDRRDDK
jgi:hypothetical protein